MDLSKNPKIYTGQFDSSVVQGTKPSRRPNHHGWEFHMDTKKWADRGVWVKQTWEPHTVLLSGSLLWSRKHRPFHSSCSFCIHHLVASTTHFLEAVSSSGCLWSFASAGSLCARNSHQPRWKEEITNIKIFLLNCKKEKKMHDSRSRCCTAEIKWEEPSSPNPQTHP